jgi:hypothetical protein
MQISHPVNPVDPVQRELRKRRKLSLPQSKGSAGALRGRPAASLECGTSSAAFAKEMVEEED